VINKIGVPQIHVFKDRKRGAEEESSAKKIFLKLRARKLDENFEMAALQSN
jgi:hypothetical protein